MTPFIPYDRLTISSEASPELIRHAILERLGAEQITAPSGRWYYLRTIEKGFRLIPYMTYSGTYRLNAWIALEPRGTGTDVLVLFCAPGVLLIAVIFVAVAIWMRTAPWKMLLGMTVIVAGLHVLLCLAYRYERRITEADLRQMIPGLEHGHRGSEENI